MSEPLLASSVRLLGSAGWSARLQPDERLPEDAWAVDPGLLSAAACTNYSDDNLRFEQLLWTVNAFAARGWLIRGPAEDGLWPIAFEDGSTDFAYLVTCWNLADMKKAAKEARWDDSASRAYTYPRADGVKRSIPRGYDAYGRQRSSLREFIG